MIVYSLISFQELKELRKGAVTNTFTLLIIFALLAIFVIAAVEFYGPREVCRSKLNKYDDAVSEYCEEWSNYYLGSGPPPTWEPITIPSECLSGDVEKVSALCSNPNPENVAEGKEDCFTKEPDYSYCEIYYTVSPPNGPPSNKCSDGTPYGECLSNRPKYCDDGNLIDKCSLCGCFVGYECQADESCKLSEPPLNTGQGLAVVPGSIYKEYILNIAEEGSDDWRVTSPDATDPGALVHLPNPVMDISIEDLDGAVKAEMLINRWGGHSGTSGKKIRFNNKPWIYLPEPQTTPTTPQNYMYQDNPVIEIPLSHLHEGINKLEGSAEGTGWPQWGWMGVIVRIYYTSDKPHPTGQITSPLSGSTLGENPTITSQAHSDVGIEKIDFLAYYEGYDENGDGYYKDWHHGYFNLRSGDTAVKISGHVESDSSSPYQVTWDTKYVPDQAAGSVKLLARIKDNNGVWYVTSYVDGLSLQRSGSSVRLYKSYNMPEKYCIRDNNKKSNKIKITDSLSKAESATIHMRTWNGQDTFHSGYNRINGVDFQIGGRNHDYKYSVINIPLSALAYGDNTAEFYSTTEHHCLEVLWPGPGIVVRYTEPIIPSLTFRHVIVDSEVHGARSIGDVDGDGFPDIIVGLNRVGLGWYEYPNWNKYSIKSIEWRADDIDSDDIDVDGDVDVVGIQFDSGEVYWFENPRPSGNPKNVWTSHYIGKNNDYVKDIEIDDFNRDGKLDVVTRTHITTSIFLQNTPTSWNNIKTINHHHHEGMDVGDLDKDGDPDIVLNGFWLENPYPNMAGSWDEHNIDSKWWNQNTGKWQDNNCVVEVADVNEDGLLDVLLSHSEKPGYPVSWYELSNPSNPEGSWTEHKIKNVFDYCQTLQAGDMDNDGDIDVVAGKFERDDGAIPSPFPLKIYFNKGGDGLSWDEIKIDDLGIYHGILGDIGDDGDLDIVGSRSYYKGPIEIRENLRSDNKLSLNRWTYIQVDNNMPYRIDRTSGPGYFFGVAMGDLTGDGYKDIVAHKMFYRNPGGNMQGTWQRFQFSTSWNWIDAFAIVDVDGDQYGDVIAEGEESSNNINIYWLEAQNTAGTSWKRVLIGTVPETGHFWSQVYGVAQIIPGGKPEILIGGGDGVYYFRIPSNPASGSWPRTKIINNGYGYATGDINNDGFLDVAGAYDSVNVAWWKNPGTGEGFWTRYAIGQTDSSGGKHADRFAVADIDRDGRKDIVVSEEVYPVTSGANIFWFKAKSDPQSTGWTRYTVVSNAWSLNSMSAADMDRDGDVDIVSGEMGSQQRVMISENGGNGNFGSPIVVGTDKESHLGARVADLDDDGDLEIISIGWNEYQYLHLWRNDAIN